MESVVERVRHAGSRAKATGLGLTIFVVWTVLLNVGPLANRPGHLVLLALAVVALLAGTALLVPRPRR